MSPPRGRAWGRASSGAGPVNAAGLWHDAGIGQGLVLRGLVWLIVKLVKYLKRRRAEAQDEYEALAERSPLTAGGGVTFGAAGAHAGTGTAATFDGSSGVQVPYNEVLNPSEFTSPLMSGFAVNGSCAGLRGEHGSPCTKVNGANCSAAWNSSPILGARLAIWRPPRNRTLSTMRQSSSAL